MFRDAAAAMQLCDFDAVMAVNDMIGVWPDLIDYAVTLHPEHLHRWMVARERMQSALPQVWAHSTQGPNGRVGRRPDRVTSDWAGSSGLFAVKVGILEGFERIVLAGVPMLPAAGHFFDHNPWSAASHFQAAWIERAPEISAHTRSMSGWTAGLLGQPDRAWLNSPEPGQLRGNQ
ncbi:hypothetical protein ACFOHM_11520 [Microbaculum marinum]